MLESDDEGDCVELSATGLKMELHEVLDDEGVPQFVDRVLKLELLLNDELELELLVATELELPNGVEIELDLAEKDELCSVDESRFEIEG
jgi:hypothetical protein